MLELLGVKVGEVIVKHAVRHWTGDGVSGELADLLTSAAAMSALDFMERRRLRRELDQLADRIAVKLSNAIDRELQNFSETEREAIILAVSDTLAASSLGPTDLLRDGLDPQLVLARLKGADPNRLAKAMLSEAGDQLYGFVLNEACNYLVEIAATLPGFATRATQELLRREGAILNRLQEALDNLPSALTPVAWGSADNDDGRFQNEYRRTVGRELDTLELFGLDIQRALQRYQLSVSFISLNVTISHLNIAQRTTEPVRTVPVQAAFAAGRRFFVLGWAGSGKTTLLQWLAVTGARGHFDADLSGWNGLVPFFLQLRRYGEADQFPKPEEFANFVAPQLAGAMPQGWVHRVLTTGAGLVLVDGIDEVREDRRDDARAWLSRLVESFPHCVFVVTSRPRAVNQSWTDMAGFRTETLEPMSSGDTRRFIIQWYDAQSGTLSPDARARYLESAVELSRVIETSTPLRNLATSPLLCAMLCALHLDRSGALPQNQAELCRVIIDVLTHRRDLGRKVSLDPPLGIEEQDVLLRMVAAWLLENDQSDIGADRLERLVEARLPFLPRVNANSTEVTAYLVARSGVLREPVPGRVDFVHRTLLEYLAARQLVADEAIGQLVSNAHLTHWRDVVTVSCAIGTRKVREELLSSLLDLADQQPATNHQISFLVVGCLQVSTELDPRLRARLDELATRLLPPRTQEDAAALAAVGDPVIELLAYEARETSVQRACIRTLELIGSPAALTSLGGYVHSGDVEVDRALVRAWSSFDPAEFAKVVLSSLAPAEAEIDDPALLPHLARVTSLRQVSCTLAGRVTSADVFAGVPDVISFADLSDCPIHDLSALRGRKALSQVKLENTGLERVDWFADSPLNTLNIARCSRLSDLGPLANLEVLANLNVRGLTTDAISTLPRLPRLVELSTDDAVWRTNVLTKVPNLISLDVSDCAASSLTFLIGLPELQQLRLDRFEFLEDLNALARLSRLKFLGVASCPRLIDQSALGELPALLSVSIGGSAELVAEAERVLGHGEFDRVYETATSASFRRLAANP